MEILKLLVPAAALLLANAAVAEQPADHDEPDGRQLLEEFVANVDTMRGRFEQSLVGADDAVVENSRGSFEIRRPGQFRWHYTEPYEQIIVADGANVWSYDVDLAQVTVKPQSEVLSNTPALLLGGGRDVLDDFDVVESFEDRGTEWVRLKPKRPDGSFDTVELGFTAGKLTRMIFADNLDQTTLVALIDVELNENLDASSFEFTPPADADLVGTPAAAPSEG